MPLKGSAQWSILIFSSSSISAIQIFKRTMAVNKHIRRGHLIVCSLIIIFVIVELSLSAWLTARFISRRNYTSIAQRNRTRFVLFSSIWTLFFVAIFMAAFELSSGENALTSVLAYGIFFLITWIIWTAAAISVTVMLGGGVNCSTQIRFVYCGQLEAMLAFSWIIWALITFCIGVVIVRAVTVARRGDGPEAQIADPA